MFEVEVGGRWRKHTYQMTWVGLGRIMPDYSLDFGSL